MPNNPQPPTIKNANTSAYVLTNGFLSFSPSNPGAAYGVISVTDPSGTNETFTASVSNGTLQVANLNNVTLTIDGNNTGSLTLTCALANLNTVLQTLDYLPNQGYWGSDTLSLSVTDTDTTLSASS